MPTVINGTTGIDNVQDAKISPAKLTVNGSGGFTLPTNAGNAVVADSSGRVTMPYQPLMYARGVVGGTPAGAATPLILTTNLINVGSNFNTSNGRFTAPIAGNYLVIYTTLKQGSGGADYQIRLNGSVFVWGFGGSDAVTVGTHAIIQLAANDYIDFSAGGNYYTNYTSYSVQLVS